MGTVYTQTWAAGNSLFTSVDHYDRSTDGVDPLYPEIREAEGVTINDGHLDWDGTSGVVGGITYGYALAGVVFNGFPAFNAQGGFIRCRYKPNATSLEQNDFAPIIIPHLFGSDATLDSIQLYWDKFAGGIDFYALDWGPGGNHHALIPYTFIAGTEYEFKLCWTCGTPADPEFSDVAADGCIQLYINGALVHEVNDFALFMDYTDGNALKEIWFGHGGLLGELWDIEFNDTSCCGDVPGEVPVDNTELCACTPSNPGTGTSGGGQGNGSTPLQTPTIGVQVLCEGGGLVPTQPDLVHSELWWGL